MKTSKLLSTFLFVYLLACNVTLSFAASFSGKVVGVTDGDTICVMHNGQAEKIRLHGIDCPESHQPYGRKAKKFVSDLVFGKVVTIEVRDTDKYGRTVGEVILSDGHSLNRELVEAGYAWWYKKYSKDDSLGILEDRARLSKRGLWADPNPVAPWDFRRGKRSGSNSNHSSGGLSERLAPSRQATDSLSERLTPAFTNIRDGSNNSLSERLKANEAIGKTNKSKVPIVFVTRTGKKYHQNWCSYLSKSKIPISLGEAKSRNIGPCSKCSPPP